MRALLHNLHYKISQLLYRCTTCANRKIPVNQQPTQRNQSCSFNINVTYISALGKESAHTIESSRVEPCGTQALWRYLLALVDYVSSAKIFFGATNSPDTCWLVPYTETNFECKDCLIKSNWKKHCYHIYVWIGKVYLENSIPNTTRSSFPCTYALTYVRTLWKRGILFPFCVKLEIYLFRQQLSTNVANIRPDLELIFLLPSAMHPHVPSPLSSYYTACEDICGSTANISPARREYWCPVNSYSCVVEFACISVTYAVVKYGWQLKMWIFAE